MLDFYLLLAYYVRTFPQHGNSTDYRSVKCSGRETGNTGTSPSYCGVLSFTLTTYLTSTCLGASSWALALELRPFLCSHEKCPVP